MTSALFQETGSKVAANSTVALIVSLLLSVSLRPNLTIVILVRLLRFLRYRILPTTRGLHCRDSSVRYPCQRFRRDGQSVVSSQIFALSNIGS